MPESVYHQRNPQNSSYYQCVEDHFEILEMVYEDRYERQYGFFRPYVKRVIYRYLDCGILKNGFSRVRCRDCGYEYLLAFVLERRGNPAKSRTNVVIFTRPVPSGNTLGVSPETGSGIWGVAMPGGGKGRSPPARGIVHPQNPAAILPLRPQAAFGIEPMWLGGAEGLLHERC